MLAFITDKYLMPCLEKLGQIFRLNDYSKGVILALGISVPEMTTNLLSVFNNDKAMIEYGLGAIVGSGVFDFTLCFGVTAIYSHYYNSRAIPLEISSLLNNFTVYLITLFYLVIICWDYKITLIESLVLVAMYPLYVYFFSVRFSSSQSQQIEETQQLIQTNHSYQDDDQIPSWFETFTFNITKHLDRVFDYQNQPILCFMIICILVYWITNFTIYSVSVIINNINVGYSFVGLTLSAWGGNIPDILNACASAKIRKTQLATQTIIGSQIINLQLCLGLPWLYSNMFIGPIVFHSSKIFASMLTVFLVVVLSTILIHAAHFRLSNSLGIQLLAVYCLYFIFQLYHQH